MLPFTRESDISRLIDMLVNKFEINVANMQCNMEQIAVETGGFPGLIQNYVRTGQFSGDKHVIGLRGL